MLYFYKILIFCMGINLVYWLTSLYCYSTDDKQVVKMAFKKVFYNMTVHLPIAVIVILPFITDNEEYDLQEGLKHLIIFIITIDFWLYVTHYLSHTKYLYKYHKVHHEYIEPSSMTALYTHWFDFYFNNILPVIIMPIIMSSDWVTIFVWLLLATFNAVYVSHSKISTDKCHLLHHKYFNYNYGVGMYMDKLFGTYGC